MTRPKKRPAPDLNPYPLYTIPDVRIEKRSPDWPDYGSDSSEGSSTVTLGPNGERQRDPHRDGGTRWMRPIDLNAREEREALNVARMRYTWRTDTGPAPQLDHPDHDSAMIYLLKVEAAIEKGGWTKSEQTGLYRERRIWRARAKGKDPRFEIIGNKSTGLDKLQTANVKQGRIVAAMMKELVNAGKIRND